MAQLVLYVDPQQGQDDRDGRSPSQPLKTLTAALRLSRGETLIRLAAGQYTASQGEQFPLVIPPGCEVQGEAGGDRPATTLQGGGTLQHPLLGTRSVTCQLLADAALNTVNITNADAQGIGIWMAAGRPRLQKVMVRQCGQHGAVALERVLPTLQDCLFDSCGQAGIAFLTQSKGQLERVFCLRNQVGVLVQDGAAPLIRSCSLERCRTGLSIAGTANPVLRDNRIRHNETYGIYLTGQGTADLGQSQEPGNNVVRDNGQVDIQNATERSLISCGNDLLPQRLVGPIELIASDLPDPSAVPVMLLDRPPDFPPSAPGEPSAPRPEELPPQGSTRFPDMANHWAGPFVDGLVAAGAIAGLPDGTFRPNRVVTRAEFAALAMASFPNRPSQQSPRQFSDLSPNFWAYEVLRQAHRTGFLSGFPDGTLRPEQAITRTQAIVAVANGLGLTGGRADDLVIYRDRAQIPSYAVDALAAATRQRLVVNHPDPLWLRPLEPMTRGELAATIYQGRVAIGLANRIASPYIVQPDITQPTFSDLDNHWAAEFIQGLAALNLVSGFPDGRFAPDAAINRAQYATLLVNAFAPNPTRTAPIFTDVPPSFWAANAIQAAYQGNFMSGFPDMTFAPSHPLLRVQVWVALVSGLYGSENPSGSSTLEDFSDHHTVPQYARPQTAIALSHRLIPARPGDRRLRPNQVATRAEACVAVYQGLVAQQRLPAIASEFIL